ncbi:response regulator transcription factor [Rugosimonospora africana]|uniref:Transcriptional regulator n=1 Tax=Rugosimonospora africana TaxID=556532 RepID=A0A8J3R4G0_9ACTN|nr:response regulator transcription factor [Rugosimonospora africana]GIH21518.1 transcriptional regulator [Rugosimonospora africana]
MSDLVVSESPRILVVEDNAELCGMLDRLLGDSGYHVAFARDGQAGLHEALTREYDVFLIDRGLPGIDGLDLVLRLRRRGLTTPVLILTAYSAVADRVAGLDAGAEDYLVKPFEVDELLARLRALRRRHLVTAEVLRLGAGEFDVAARVVRLADGTEVELSGREAALLRVLAARPTRVFSRDELRERAFEAAESASIVDTYVHYLRRKLGSGAVRTVRGLGYRAGVL